MSFYTWLYFRDVYQFGTNATGFEMTTRIRFGSSLVVWLAIGKLKKSLSQFSFYTSSFLSIRSYEFRFQTAGRLKKARIKLRSASCLVGNGLILPPSSTAHAVGSSGDLLLHLGTPTPEKGAAKSQQVFSSFLALH